MDTFELLPVIAQGDLADTSAPEVVAAIFRSRASGTLSLESEGGVEIRQFFRGGDMCGSAFFAGFRTLAQVLLANDWVGALDIDASLAEATAQHKRHGHVLVERGLLNPEQLKAALVMQHQQNLAALLSIDRGPFEMRGWEPPPAWSRELTIDPVSVVVDALSADRMTARRQRVLQWLGSHAARLSVEWPEISTRALLGPAERRAAALLALPRRLSEFVSASRLPQSRAEGLLVGLLLVGAAEAHPQGATAPPPASTSPAPPPVSQPQPPPPIYIPTTPPPTSDEPQEQEAQAADRQVDEPISEPVLISSDGEAAGGGNELVPLETDQAPGPEPMRQQQPEPSFPPQGPRPVPPAPAKRPATMPPTPRASIPSPPRASIPSPPRSAPQPARSAPPTLRDDEAFARLEALAMEETVHTNESAPLPYAPLAPDSLPPPPAPPAPPPQQRGSSGLRAAYGGGFEFDGDPNDPLPDIEQHAARPDVQAAIPSQSDDRASAVRKKLLQRGLRNMGQGPSASAPPEWQSPTPEGPQAPVQVDESTLSPDDRRFAEEVRKRAARVAEEDAFARLGLPRTASTEQVRAAYLVAAKRYHPDRSSMPAFGGLHDELNVLFNAARMAYEQIGTSSAREQYLRLLETGRPITGKVQSRKEEAALAMRMGDVMLKKRDFAAALSKLRRAIELDPNGDSLAALAWGLMCDPGTSPAGKEESATLINKALRAPGLSARTYYVAGVLWRTKDPDSAADAFRKALELEPNHADASLELRLLEMRQGKKQSGGGVLSGLLFGKRKS